MHPTTKKLMDELNVKPEQIHLPTRGIAIFGRSGTGKSSQFYNSEFVKHIIIADTGSYAHTLYCKGMVTEIDATQQLSPIEQVLKAVKESTQRGEIAMLDSFSTLQEQEVAWLKRELGKNIVSQQMHGTVVGNLRDLALELAKAQVFTIFNTTPGGIGKAPDGSEIKYPAGAITGYPSLNGMNPSSESILARWGNTWGVFQGHGDIPRGLYVPGRDIRPEYHASYSPIKDPMMIINSTSDDDKQAIMAVPNLRLKENDGRCFIDEMLIRIAAKFPKKQPTTSKPAEKQAK